MKLNKGIILAASLLLMATSIAGAKSTTKKKKAKTAAQTEQVIFTGEIAKKIIGYQGTTPLNITVKNGKIQKIEALPNREDPQYMKRAANKVFPQFEGLTVQEGINLKADAATGATYTSEALIKNIKMGLEQAKKK